jgi:hypothetical protein
MVTTFSCALFAIATAAYSQTTTLPAGTTVAVRTNQAIDGNSAAGGQFFAGVVAQDVHDSRGRVAIPRGSYADLTVRRISDKQMAVDLDSITVGGQRYMVGSDVNTQTSSKKPGLGKNKRTAKFVGGGALFGTVIGAIGGGGTGALVGGLVGGAAGAGAQVLTRGKTVKVPAESVLTFRLNSPLRLGANGGPHVQPR